MEERILYCLIVFGFFHIPTRTQAAGCDPTKEGSRHDIFYQVTSQQMKDVNWFQRQGDNAITLASCTFFTDNSTFTCDSRDPSKYEIQENNNNFTLTILNVSRVGLTPYFFTVSGDASPQYTCNLTVYAPPESPSCQPPTLTPDNTALSVTCSTDKVFPQAQCVFRRQGVQGNLSDVSYTHESYTTSDGVIYYRSTCTLTYPVNTTGSYAFVVDMFVNIAGIRYGLQQSPVSDSITLYEAAIQTFTANHNHTLTVDLHDSINLTCVADGNPTPTIIIQNHRGTDQKSVEGYRLTYVKDNVTCTDTAVYTCQANNFLSMDESSKAHVQVFVKCPQQRQHGDNILFYASVGDTVTLDLDVVGYPAPRSYTLEQKQKVVAQVNTADGNGESGTYHFKYLSNDPPFGKVQLTIGNIGQEHFTYYLLTIDNGVGQALEYNLVLETVSDTDDDDDIAVIVGVPFGIAVLIIAVIMLLVLKRQEMLIICADFRKRSDYAKNSTVETAPADFQRSRPTSTIYDNVVPLPEPASADSHSPDEN